MNPVYKISNLSAYRKAWPDDLVELNPVPSGHPLFFRKWILEAVAYGICHAEFIHLSGPTGTAKSSLIESLVLEPGNFLAILRGMGLPEKPLRVFPVEMAAFETPGDLYSRRALSDGTTYDEKSALVEALEQAAAAKDEAYPLIWLREMGRVHSPSVQGGLLDLMCKGSILLPGGARISGDRIAWIADSNYQAEHDATHTLVTFDDALKRRFSMNVTLDYLPAEMETAVLDHLMKRAGGPSVSRDLIVKVVALGQEVRRLRSEGQMQSVPPPTLYGYLSFLRMAQSMPKMPHPQIALVTVLGNAGLDDQKAKAAVLNQAFGLRSDDTDSAVFDGNLF
jgi:hypothetical protein